MKNISLGAVLFGLILLLSACKNDPIPNTPPYECLIPQNFTQAHNFTTKNPEFSSFEWQAGGETLMIEWCSLSRSELQENPDEAVATFFHDRAQNEENTLGRGSVNFMGFEKEGMLCLSESHIQLPLEQINDDANIPEEVNHTLRLSCWYPAPKAEPQEEKNQTSMCLSEIGKQIFATPQFAEVKAAYDEALNNANNEENDQFLGYTFNLEKEDSTSYEIALVEDYTTRALSNYRFQVEKKSGKISLYDVITDSYDEQIPTDAQYADFFIKNCQNLGGDK